VLSSPALPETLPLDRHGERVDWSVLIDRVRAKRSGNGLIMADGASAPGRLGAVAQMFRKG
jgi:hypothetical protein